MPFPHGHALIIGVGTYQHEPRLNVPTTTADAQAVAEVLRDPRCCGYVRSQETIIRLLASQWSFCAVDNTENFVHDVIKQDKDPPHRAAVVAALAGSARASDRGPVGEEADVLVGYSRHFSPGCAILRANLRGQRKLPSNCLTAWMGVLLRITLTCTLSLKHCST
jgi:hypothetical protein